MATWGLLIIATCSVSLVAGCSSTGLVLCLRDRNSQAGLAGVQVSRYRPVGRLEKVFNPVGAFYHPYRLAETLSTDAFGQVAFANVGGFDEYRFNFNQPRSMALYVEGREVPIRSAGDLMGATNRLYVLYAEAGAMLCVVNAVRGDDYVFVVIQKEMDAMKTSATNGVAPFTNSIPSVTNR